RRPATSGARSSTAPPEVVVAPVVTEELRAGAAVPEPLQGLLRVRHLTDRADVRQDGRAQVLRVVGVAEVQGAGAGALHDVTGATVGLDHVGVELRVARRLRPARGDEA